MRVTDELLEEIRIHSTFRAGNPSGERSEDDPLVIQAVEEVLCVLDALPDTVPVPEIHAGTTLPDDVTIVRLTWYGIPFVKRLLSLSFSGDKNVTVEYQNFEKSGSTRYTVSNIISSLLEKDMVVARIRQITSE